MEKRDLSPTFEQRLVDAAQRLLNYHMELGEPDDATRLLVFIGEVSMPRIAGQNSPDTPADRQPPSPSS